jgi:hypothetical protein
MEDAMRLKLAGAIVAGLLLTGLSAAPAAATTNTITTGSPVTLKDRVLVTVPLTVVCDPLPGPNFDTTVNVTVTQASGRAVATGSTGTETTPAPLFTCDGVTPNHLVLKVLPGSGSPPFHGGGAIVQASFNIFSFTCGCSESGNTTTPVKIRG